MRVCRTCLSRNNLSPLFGEPNSVRFDSNQLFKATGVQIKQNDGLSDTSCKSCIQTIKEILQFREICTKTDEILKSIINIKTENDRTQDRNVYQDVLNGNDDEHFYDTLKSYPQCEVFEESLNTIHSNDEHFETDDDDKKLITFVNKKVEKRKLPHSTFNAKFKKKIRNQSKIIRHLEQTDDVDTAVIKIEDFESTSSESGTIGIDDEDFDLSVPHNKDAVWLTKENLADTNKMIRLEKKSNYLTQPKTSGKSRKKIMERNKKLMGLALTLEGSGQLECRLCHKQVERASFVNHAKKHFEPEFACEFCGRKFHSRNHMVYHQQRRHGKQKRLACTKCPFRAVDRDTLIRHERSLHTLERPYVCAECGDAFGMRANMVQHMRKHFGVKNRQCDRCPAMFKTLSELWSHQSKVHFMTYTYPCYLCPAKYKGGLALKRHILNVHGIPREQQQKVKCVKTRKCEDAPLNSNHLQEHSVFSSYINL